MGGTVDTLFIRAPPPVCMCGNLEKIQEQNNGRENGFRHASEIH